MDSKLSISDGKVPKSTIFLIKLLKVKQQIFQRQTSLLPKHCFVTVTELHGGYAEA
jgi:hypothetical protein